MDNTPATDGISHINVYSKGKTELGRFLTNFAHTPIETEDGHFESIEGYWYWLSCKDNKLRTLYGWQAKDYGRKAGAKDWLDDVEFKRKICAAIKIKLDGNPNMMKQLTNNKLPLDHYYAFGVPEKIVRPKDGRWILDYIISLKG